MSSEREKEAAREFFRVNGMDADEERQASAWFAGLFLVALVIATIAFLSWLVGLFLTFLIFAAVLVPVGAFVWWLTGY